MNEDLYRLIINNATDAVVVTAASEIDSPEGPRIVFVNEAYCEMTGYSEEEVLGKTPRLLQGPKTDRKELNKLRHAIERGEPGYAELINYKKSGEKFWTSIKIFPLEDDSGNIRNWVGIKRDITDQKKAYEELKVALQELHHRVKNNLAVISAMIQLHALNEKEEYVKNKLLHCTSRIKTIADVHEFLYRSDSLAHIELGECIESLVNDIVNTLQFKKDIEVLVDAQDAAPVNIVQAVPFALVVNEVITNSLLHAFHDTGNPKIEVTLSRDSDEISMTISDNGRGMPEDFDPDEHVTTGMQLITTLAKQLEAGISYANSGRGDGTIFSMQFVRKDIDSSNFRQELF